MGEFLVVGLNEEENLNLTGEVLTFTGLFSSCPKINLVCLVLLKAFSCRKLVIVKDYIIYK